MLSINANLPNLHHILIRYIAETGHAPDIEQLSTLAGLSRGETERSLRELAANRGVILEPDSLRIWSVHPFALMPTSFWAEGERGGWWANCAWCALAIGAALKQDTTIHASDGTEREALELRIRSGRPSLPTLLMHFPYPPARWWDNPFCPCGNILFFTSEARIDQWCARHGRPRGYALDIQTGIRLTEKWFGDYASPDWRRKTGPEFVAIFRELSLDQSFWKL